MLLAAGVVQYIIIYKYIIFRFHFNGCGSETLVRTTN